MAFWDQFATLFNELARHIVAAWFLSNTKIELIRPLKRRQLILFFTTDFAENILVIRKHELSEQYYHRIEILLFGAVASFVVKVPEIRAGEANSPEGKEAESQQYGREEDDEQRGLGLNQRSYMVSSDYRYVWCIASYHMNYSG